MVPRIDFGAGYVPRVLDEELDILFPELPAVLLDGPKGVGKTETALQRCRTAWQLDDRAERRIIEADPAIIGSDEPPVLIDEWHRAPEVFDAVRRLVDRDPSGGRFLLTGSAPRTPTHSGAGRITTMRMRPLALCERIPVDGGVSFRDLLADDTTPIGGRCDLALTDYVDEVVGGGFPGMRSLGPRARTRQLDSYLDRIVDHDLAEAGFTSRRPSTLRAWLRAYAAATATTTSWDKIRNAATSGTDDKPAKTTTIPYIEFLTALRILDPLPAWAPTSNHLAALSGSPKHHLADPALAARLVRLDAPQLMRGKTPDTLVPRDGTFLGALFESLVALSIRSLAQASDARVHHLRTHGGRHEIDFIVETDDGVIGVEAKLNAAIDDPDVKHLHWLRDQLGDDCRSLLVVNTGSQAYRRRDGIAVVPLGLLGL